MKRDTQQPTGRLEQWHWRTGGGPATSSCVVEAVRWFDARAEAMRVLGVGPSECVLVSGPYTKETR